MPARLMEVFFPAPMEEQHGGPSAGRSRMIRFAGFCSIVGGFLWRQGTAFSKRPTKEDNGYRSTMG